MIFSWRIGDPQNVLTLIQILTHLDIVKVPHSPQTKDGDKY